MKAIKTKYKSATNNLGPRIIAKDCDGNRVSIEYPHGLSAEYCHRCAANALMKKMKWHGKLHSGTVKYGYVFVIEEFS
jgi:hypothetical protein